MSESSERWVRIEQMFDRIRAQRAEVREELRGLLIRQAQFQAALKESRVQINKDRDESKR